MKNPYQTIKDAIDIKEVIEKHAGVEFKKDGKYHTTACMLPGHPDDTDPSFKIEEGSQRFKCYGCNEGGDVFDFYTLYGLAHDDQEAMKRIAAEYQLTISESDKASFAIKNLSGLKKDITEYAHKLLLGNSPALSFLKTRGFTDAMIKKWKIGISDGKLYQHFRKVYKKKDDEPMYEMLVQSGIAKQTEKGEIFEFINANILMYPAYIGSNVSHWDLREASKQKKYKYQIPTTKREGGVFFNQKATAKMEFWLVEGRDDCIFMEDVAKVPCAGLLGSTLGKAQLEHLMQYVAYEDDMPGGVTKKTINLLMDGDTPGKKASAALSNALADYFDINIVVLPDGMDPHEFLLNDGELNQLERRRVTRAASRVHEVNNQYVYSTNEDSQQIISDFTVSVEYEIEDVIEDKSYMVRLHKDKAATPLLTLNAEHWSSTNGMRKWVGIKGGGGFNLYASDIQLMHMKRYMFDKFQPKKIKLIDAYGEAEPDLRVFDNACVYKGELYRADDDGISWINKGPYEGIKTTSVKSRDSLRFPEEYDTAKHLVAKCDHYYERNMVITLLGFATYSIFFRQVTEKYSISPILFCYGPTTRGKTLLANIIQGLCGAGGYKEIMPNHKATSNALIRVACRCNSLPILLDEFRNNKDREEMARAWFNLSPKLLAQKTNDLQTHSFEFNSPAIMASTERPVAEDVLNRMLIIDFLTFYPKFADFNFFFDDCYTSNRGAGFMMELVKAKAGENIVRNIEACKKEFAMDIKNPRMLIVMSIVAGSYLTAHKALKIDDLLGEANPASIKAVFSSLAKASDERGKRAHLLSAFFRYVKIIYENDEEFDRIANIKKDKDNNIWVIEIQPDQALLKSQFQARRAGREDLDGATEDEIDRYLRELLGGEKCRPSMFSEKLGKPKQGYGVRVDMKQIRDVCAVEFGVDGMDLDSDVYGVPF